MAGETGVVREVHVKREYNLLSESLTALESNMADIEARFSDVLRKETDVLKTPLGKTEEELVPHAYLLREARTRIDAVNAKLRSLLVRCEL